jgi:hypothetical protein
VDPSEAFVAHNPFLTIICFFVIDLLAVNAIELLFVLIIACLAQIVHVVLLLYILSGWLVLLTEFVAAYIGIFVGLDLLGG